jgi:hypothetical protein
MGAVLAVQSPSHFDLPYRKDWKGMKFGHLLNGFKGPVRLMHGSESGVCTAQQVKDLQREFPKAQVLEVAGAAHPVPFNAEVNQFVLQALHLPAVTQIRREAVLEAPAPSTLNDVIPAQTPDPVVEPQPVLQASPQRRVGLFELFKKLLGAIKS